MRTNILATPGKSILLASKGKKEKKKKKSTSVTACLERGSEAVK